MIRFKVVKGSKLLLGIAVAALAIVLGLVVYRMIGGGGPSGDGSGAAPYQQTIRHTGAKTASVFAPTDDQIAAPLSLDPEDPAEPIRYDPRQAADAAQRDPTPPRVLIYHTHTHEAYEQVNSDPYVAIEAWRTTDADHSVVRVGEELARLLRRDGFEVVHDVTDHEGSDLATAYTRSLQTLLNYDTTFDLYIDVHRDAYSQGLPMGHVLSDGTSAAQLMPLIGNGNGFAEKPFFEQNYAFACALCDEINALEPGLCRKVLVKDGRYNQHIGVFSVLIEVGHNKNTLAEAINALPVLSEAIRCMFADKAALAAMKAIG